MRDITKSDIHIFAFSQFAIGPDLYTPAGISGVSGNWTVKVIKSCDVVSVFFVLSEKKSLLTTGDVSKGPYIKGVIWS